MKAVATGLVLVVLAAAGCAESLAASDVLAVQAATIEFLARQSTSVGVDRLCIRVATGPGEMVGVMVANRLEDPPASLVERLRSIGVWVEPYSACGVETANSVLAIGWPAPTASGAEVAADHRCGVDCGGGFAVEVRRTDTDWRAVAARVTWIP